MSPTIKHFVLLLAAVTALSTISTVASAKPINRPASHFPAVLPYHDIVCGINPVLSFCIDAVFTNVVLSKMERSSRNINAMYNEIAATHIGQCRLPSTVPQHKLTLRYCLKVLNIPINHARKHKLSGTVRDITTSDRTVREEDELEHSEHILGLLEDAVEGIFDGIKGFGNLIAKGVEDAFKIVSSGIEDGFNAIKDLGEKVGKGFIDFNSGIVKTIVGGLSKNTKSIFDGLPTDLKELAIAYCEEDREGCEAFIVTMRKVAKLPPSQKKTATNVCTKKPAGCIGFVALLVLGSS